MDRPLSASSGVGWLQAGHKVAFGVRDPSGATWSGNHAPEFKTVEEAAGDAPVIIVAIPAPAAADVGAVLARVTGIKDKIIIDATNSIFRGPEGYKSSYEALRSLTGVDVIKCFNSTGAENMAALWIGISRSTLGHTFGFRLVQR